MFQKHFTHRVLAVMLCTSVLCSDVIHLHAAQTGSDTFTITATESTEDPKNTESLESTESTTPDGETENSGEVKRPESTEGSKNTENSGEGKDSESSESSEGTKDSESSESSEGTKDSENSESSEGTKDSESSENSGETKSSESSESSRLTETTENTESIDPAENTEVTESTESTIFSVTGSDETESQTSETEDATEITGTVIDGYYVINVFAASMNKSGASKAIQDALDYAARNATASLPCKIIIEPGSYTLTKCLYISSNTYLFMNGVTFTQDSKSRGNMLKVGESKDTATGYYYSNITIDGGKNGGIFDENRHSSTVIKIGHASNFTANNITLQNTVDAHLMEVAGTDGLNLSGCTFQNQTLKKTLYYEAIQLDILHPKHFGGYAAEVLMNRNINITGCTFRNVPRGIGSHTVILNSYMTDINITGNTFLNTSSAAIQLMAVTNCNVSGNTITNCPRGILFYSIFRDCEGSYFASTIAKLGDVPTNVPSTYNPPPDNQNIVVSGNTITLGGSDLYNKNYENTGIYFSGYHFTSAMRPSDGDVIPAANYYISGATVTGNTITTNQNGITMQDARNIYVDNNTVIFNNFQNKSCGIQMREDSVNCTVSNNLVNGNAINSNYPDSMFGGISILESKANTITDNTVFNYNGYGIYARCGEAASISGNNISQVNQSSIYLNSVSVPALNANTINLCTKDGITAKDCVIQTISDNKIMNTGGYGISQNGNTVQKITNNTLSLCTNHSIVLYNNAITGEISGNTITSGKSAGINIGKIGAKIKISGNTVQGCQTAQIYVNNDSAKTVTISSNSLGDSSKAAGFRVDSGIRIDSGKFSITGNTIKYCKNAIRIRGNANGTIYKNKLQKNKSNTAQITSSTNTHKTKKYAIVSTPSSVKAKTLGKNKIQISWKKVKNADSYRIYRATSKKGKYKKIATISNPDVTSYISRKLKKNTKYYYKVVACKKTVNKNVTLFSSDSKIVSKKTSKK